MSIDRYNNLVPGIGFYGQVADNHQAITQAITQVITLPGDTICTILGMSIAELYDEVEDKQQFFIIEMEDTGNSKAYFDADSARTWMKENFSNPNTNLPVRCARSLQFERKNDDGTLVFKRVAKCTHAYDLYKLGPIPPLPDSSSEENLRYNQFANSFRDSFRDSDSDSEVERAIAASLRDFEASTRVFHQVFHQQMYDLANQNFYIPAVVPLPYPEPAAPQVAPKTQAVLSQLDAHLDAQIDALFAHTGAASVREVVNEMREDRQACDGHDAQVEKKRKKPENDNEKTEKTKKKHKVEKHKKKDKHHKKHKKK